MLIFWVWFRVSHCSFLRLDGCILIIYLSATPTPNPASGTSSSQMLPTPGLPIRTARTSPSASDIISDDDTPITSITFEDTTADAPRRSKRDSKRKAKERWAKTSCADLNLACNFFLYNYVNSGWATCKWWLRTSHNNSIWLGIDFLKFQPLFKIAFQMVAPPSYMFPSPVGPFFSDFLCIRWLK